MPIQLVVRTYQFFCSIKLTVTLLLLLVADLSLGYICLQGKVSLFQPMNEVGLSQWLLTYARSQPLDSAWFLLLLPLLSLLGINTLCCTGEKLYHLVRSQHTRLPANRLWLTLSIHLMHLAMILLLAGYLTSYTLSTIYPSITLTPGLPLTVPGSSLQVELLEMQMIPYSRNRLIPFLGRNIDVNAHLLFKDGKEQVHATLAMNRPVHIHGFSFFLQRFNPTRAGGMSPSQYIIFDIRRDPGVLPTFIAMGAFLTGLFGYLFFRHRTRKRLEL